MDPRLSVIVAAWNAEATIADALASVLEETEVALECIVVDDGSTDGTAGILEAIASRDPRVRLLRSPDNRGVSAARNLALDVAKGTWLAFLDADDRLLPGGLRAMVEAGDTRDALAVVGQRISTDGERTWIPVLYDWPDIREAGRKSIVRNPDLLYYAGPVGKLFHRTCAAGLRFEGRVLGDQPWVIRSLLRAGDAIEVLSTVVYEWRRPHADHGKATITSARTRSAALATVAVEMAGRAFSTVMTEVEGTVEPELRHRIAVTYLERLLRADLEAQLTGAVRRADRNTARLLVAMRTFLDGIPPGIRADTDAIGTAVLAAPLQSYLGLGARARVAYLSLVRAALRANPRVLDPLPARRGRTWLRKASRLPPALSAPLLTFVLRAGAWRRSRTASGSRSASPPGPRHG